MCLVVKKLNDVLYCVKLRPKSETTVVHVDRLSKFHGDPPHGWAPYVGRQASADVSRESRELNIVPTSEPNDVTRDKHGQCGDRSTSTAGRARTRSGEIHLAQTKPPLDSTGESDPVSGQRPQRSRRRPRRYCDVNNLEIRTRLSVCANIETEVCKSEINHRLADRIDTMDAKVGPSTSKPVARKRKRT